MTWDSYLLINHMSIMILSAISEATCDPIPLDVPIISHICFSLMPIWSQLDAYCMEFFAFCKFDIPPYYLCAQASF